MNDQTNAPTEAVAKTTIRPNTENYVTAKSGTGKRTQRIDDFVARTLDGKTLAEVESGAQSLGIENKWGHLNPGQQRMLIGNALRQATRRTKEPLSESAITAVFGEPAAPYDEEAAAKAKAEAAAKREADAKAKAEAKAKKAEEAAAKKAAKEAEAAAKAEAGEGEAAPAKPQRKSKPKAVEQVHDGE